MTADVARLREDTAGIVALCDEVHSLQVELTRKVGAWAETRWWAFDGARSAADWLALFGRLDGADARRLVARAELCERLPAFGAAVESGEVSIAHLDVLGRAIGDRRRDHAARDEGALLEAARHQSMPEWERTLAGWTQHCDRELAADDVEAVWNGRFLHVRHDLFGTGHVRGQLDPDGAAALSAALAARRSDPDPAGGPPRTLGQRNADALVALATDDSPVSVTLVVDHDLDRRATIAPRCEVDGVPVPAVTAERLTCGASESVVTRRGRSIIDVTESTPTVTTGQRRALLVRDPTCRFPGCAVAAHRCDVHHLRRRIEGGEHRLDNLVHLCRHHHRFVHEHRWRHDGDPDGRLDFHPPPGDDDQ